VREIKGTVRESFDFGTGFKLLSFDGRVSVIKTAKTLLKVQQENKDVITGISVVLPVEDENRNLT
jgi:hypothetical protein